MMMSLISQKKKEGQKCVHFKRKIKVKIQFSKFAVIKCKQAIKKTPKEEVGSIEPGCAREGGTGREKHAKMNIHHQTVRRKREIQRGEP